MQLGRRDELLSHRANPLSSLPPSLPPPYPDDRTTSRLVSPVYLLQPTPSSPSSSSSSTITGWCWGGFHRGEFAVCGRMLRQWYNRMILGAPGPFPVCKLATYNYHTSNWLHNWCRYITNVSTNRLLLLLLRIYIYGCATRSTDGLNFSEKLGWGGEGGESVVLTSFVSRGKKRGGNRNWIRKGKRRFRAVRFFGTSLYLEGWKESYLQVWWFDEVYVAWNKRGSWVVFALSLYLYLQIRGVSRDFFVTEEFFC